MKTKIRILILFIVLPYGGFSQEMLHQYMRTAAENNPGLRAKFNTYNASLEKIPQVGVLPDPNLSFGYFIMPVETKNGPQNFKVSLTQMLPWFGSLQDKENSYMLAAKANYENFEDSKLKLFYNVKSTFYDLYYIQKGIDITQENIKVLETLKRLVMIKIETGKASTVDALRVEIELNDLNNNLAVLKDKWLTSTVKFNNLLNVDNEAKILVPKRLWTDDLQYNKQELMIRLKTDNHQIKRFEFLKESSFHKEQFVKKQGKPKLLFGVDYTSIGNTGTSPFAGKDAFQVKIGISIPLYRKKYNAMLKETLFQQQVIDDNKEDRINTLETLFEKAYNAYIDANRRFILFKEQDQLAKRAIQLLEIDYANSGQNFEEILRMDKNVLTYALALEKARTDKQAAIAFIHYLIAKK